MSFPSSELGPPPPPCTQRGGSNTPLQVRGLGDPIRTTEKKAWHSEVLGNWLGHFNNCKKSFVFFTIPILYVTHLRFEHLQYIQSPVKVKPGKILHIVQYLHLCYYISYPVSRILPAQRSLPKFTFPIRISTYQFYIVKIYNESRAESTAIRHIR